MICIGQSHKYYTRWVPTKQVIHIISCEPISKRPTSKSFQKTQCKISNNGCESQLLDNYISHTKHHNIKVTGNKRKQKFEVLPIQILPLPKRVIRIWASYCDKPKTQLFIMSSFSLYRQNIALTSFYVKGSIVILGGVHYWSPSHVNGIS